MNLKIIMILSSIFSSSSSVASLFPALNFESTCFAANRNTCYLMKTVITWSFTDTAREMCY